MLTDIQRYFKNTDLVDISFTEWNIYSTRYLHMAKSFLVLFLKLTSFILVAPYQHFCKDVY